VAAGAHAVAVTARHSSEPVVGLMCSFAGKETRDGETLLNVLMSFEPVE
jgi:hypothetical protein